MKKNNNLILVSSNQREAQDFIFFCYDKGIDVSWTAYDFDQVLVENENFESFLNQFLKVYSIIEKPILTFYKNFIIFIDNKESQYIFLNNQHIKFLSNIKEIGKLKIFKSNMSILEYFCSWFANEYE